MRSLIQIQDQYVETVNAGYARWSHRKNGGHRPRINRGARHVAEKQLRKWGFTEPQIDQIIRDAQDMAQLIRLAEDSEEN